MSHSRRSPAPEPTETDEGNRSPGHSMEFDCDDEEKHESSVDADLRTKTPTTASSFLLRRKRGRPKKVQDEHPVHKLFEVQKTTEGVTEFACKVNRCGIKVPGNHAGNKMSHLKTHHNEVHQNVQESWDRKTGMSSSTKQARTEPRVLNGVQMSGPALQLHSLRLISENGLSFKALDYSSFQDIIRPMIKAMPAKERVTISSNTIPPKISGFAARVRDKIAAELEGKMSSVMVDGCSKGRRHFIGVNVQYAMDGKHVVRTLAVEELHISQTGANLKQVITRILRKYGIPLKSVVSFTSDNGPNYVLAGRLMSIEDAERQLQDYEEMPWSELDVEISHGDFRIQIVRCAAHTLQLAFEDALKAEKLIVAVISAVRELAKFLRSPTNGMQLKECGLPIPILDVVTRWGSTFDMLVSVAKLRNYVEFTMNASAKDRTTYFLSDEQWEVVEDAIAVLDPIRKATTKLQAASLTLGQFLAIWTEALMRLRKRAEVSSLARNLVQHMEEKSKPALYKDKKKKGRAGTEKISSLFHYPSFNASVYLDPRYFSLLTPEQITDGRSYLLELWARLQAVRGVAPLAEGEDADDPDPVDTDHSSSDDEEGSFAKFLALKNRERQVNKGGHERRRAQPATARARITKQLEEYDELTSPLPESADVFEFWEGQRLIWPELSELAKIVLAIPATQVSVERLFSALRFILRPLRYNLSEKNIDDIVFLHANHDLVEQLAAELLCEANFSWGEASPSPSTSSLSSSTSMVSVSPE